MKRHRKITRSNRRRGVTTVEFSIVAIVLFLMVFGLFEFGRMVMIQQALTNASREACREAVLASTISTADVDTTLRTRLRGAIANATDVNKVRVNITPNSLNNLAAGTPITVSVDVDYDDVALFSPWFLRNVEIHKESQMNRE